MFGRSEIDIGIQSFSKRGLNIFHHLQNVVFKLICKFRLRVLLLHVWWNCNDLLSFAVCCSFIKPTRILNSLLKLIVLVAEPKNAILSLHMHQIAFYRRDKNDWAKKVFCLTIQPQDGSYRSSLFFYCYSLQTRDSFPYLICFGDSFDAGSDECNWNSLILLHGSEEDCTGYEQSWFGRL